MAGDSLQPVLVPMANGPRCRASDLCGFTHVVAAQPLDATRAMAAVRHGSLPQAGYKGTDILNPPRCGFRAEFYRFGEAPCLDALPPRGLTDGNRAVRGDDGGKANETGFGKRFVV